MPLISQRLYGRLEREAKTHGEPVMRIISECVQTASMATINPGAWFRSAVSRRLREHGFLLNKRQEEQVNKVSEIRAKVAAAIGDGRGCADA